MNNDDIKTISIALAEAKENIKNYIELGYSAHYFKDQLQRNDAAFEALEYYK
tara:strand:+ start:62 stop:217 length:156 start_codon:yes stop_codon:yes gene_type:complete